MKIGLVLLIHILLVYRSIHYLHFSFQKNIPFHVLKDFSAENL